MVHHIPKVVTPQTHFASYTDTSITQITTTRETGRPAMVKERKKERTMGFHNKAI
jgi:hypothetical protein